MDKSTTNQEHQNRKQIEQMTEDFNILTKIFSNEMKT